MGKGEEGGGEDTDLPSGVHRLKEKRTTVRIESMCVLQVRHYTCILLKVPPDVCLTQE